MADDPSSNCHVEYSSCLMAVVPLSAGCTIVTGVPSFVTAGFVEVKGEWEQEDGTDYSAKAGNGRYCGPELRGPTIRKWINLTGIFCAIDWSLLATMGDASLTLDADDNVVGYSENITPAAAPCVDPTGPKFALAVITRAAAAESGGPCTPTDDVAGGFTTALAHIYGYVTDFKHDAAGHEDARRMVNWTAKAYPNPNIGRGPFNLYPALRVPTALPNNPHWEGFVSLGSLPTPSCAPIVHPTVVAPA